MKDKGYTVEYVPPRDNAAIFQRLFAGVRAKLAADPSGPMIDDAPGNFKEEDNSYYYAIPLKDDKGRISFAYDDYTADMEFEEFMHTGAADRGRISIDIKIHVPQSEEQLYEQELKRLDKEKIPDARFERGKSGGVISASIAYGDYIVNPDENDVNILYKQTTDLWSQIKLVIDETGTSL